MMVSVCGLVQMTAVLVIVMPNRVEPVGLSTNTPLHWRQITRIVNYWTWGADTQGIVSHPNLIELAQELNLTTCVENLSKIGADKVLNHEGWFTLFCPTNEAFVAQKYFPEEETLVDTMRMHVARGLFESSSFRNEKLYKSLLSKRRIRMNIYPEKSGLVTANGQPVIQSDYRARNGLVHIISGVMTSVYARSGSVISEMKHCCPEHSTVIRLAKKAGLYEKIHKTNPITFLVPTNGAFDRLHPKFAEYLEKKPSLLKKILEAHVLPGTWYTVGLSQRLHLRSWAGDAVTVTLLPDGRIRFSGALAYWANISAQNGVSHVVESLIIPSSAKADVQKILKSLRG